MRLRACTYVAIILMFMALAPSTAHAEPILYSVSRDDDLLRVVNPSTGGTISSVPITLAGKVVSFGTGLPLTLLRDNSSPCSRYRATWTATRDNQSCYRCCDKYRQYRRSVCCIGFQFQRNPFAVVAIKKTPLGEAYRVRLYLP